MNRVTGAVNVPELTAANQPKAKTRPADGEFKEMLSGALKSTTKAAAGTQAKKMDEASSPETKPAKGAKPAKKAQFHDADETQAAETATDTINPNMAAVQPPQEPQQTTESAEAEEVQALLMVQPMQTRQILIQPLETQQANPAQAQETAAALPQTAEAMPAETAAQTQPVQAQPPQTSGEVPAAVTQEQPPEQAQAAQAAEANDAAQDTRNQQLPDEITADVVSTGTVGQTAGTQAARVHTNSRQAAAHNDKPSRFDELLAKASQELGQNKPIITEQPAATADTPVQTAEITGNPVQTMEITEDSVLTDEAAAFEIPETTDGVPEENAESMPVETDTQTDAKPQTQATVIKSEPAPKFEQRPLKEIPKTDEAVLGMIQPKPNEIPLPEVAKSEPQVFANPVKIPDQAEQIHTQVIENLEKQKMEFNMQLNPKELGKVDVRMILESGKLSVEIVAANQKSTELLTKQAEGLIASLKMSNLDISSVNIVQASETTSGNMDGQYNLNNFQNQANTRGHGNSNSSNHGHGGNSESFDAQPEEAPESPQKLLNYSV